MNEGQLALAGVDVETLTSAPPAVVSRDPALEAARWRDANPEGWKMLVGWALSDAQRGRRCSIAFYCELLRRPEYHTSRAVGCPYVLNNTARAGLVRLLIAERPELARCFEVRASRADSLKNDSPS
jgi:hypothetical protein